MKTLRIYSLILSLSLTILSLILSPSQSQSFKERKIHVSNRGSKPVHVDWINPDDGQGHFIITLQSGDNAPFNTFIGHTFMVRGDEDVCENKGECQMLVNEDESQEFLIDDNLIIRRVIDQTSIRMNDVERFQSLKTWYRDGDPLRRKVLLINKSNTTIFLFWRTDDNRWIPALEDDMFFEHGISEVLNSMVGHSFQIREVLGEDRRMTSCDDRDRGCHAAYFSVNSNEEQAIIVNQGLEIRHLDDTTPKTDKSEFTTITQSETKLFYKKYCQEKFKKSLESSQLVHDLGQLALDDMKQCISLYTKQKILETKKQKNNLSTIRHDVAGKWENYTCADPILPTTSPLQTQTWSHNDTARQVHILHNRDASKIHLIHDFISPEECRAIEQDVEGRLQYATTENDKPGERSKYRRAMQAGVVVPWSKELQGDHIAAVARRVLDYTNSVTDLNLDIFGQEDLASIQYEGKGEEEEFPDQYYPHCDGQCNGAAHVTTGRVATMVMYCVVPTKGGATNFLNSGVHVVPKEGAAIFFSYLDDNTGLMDDAFTKHSGCPVIRGEKKLVTQWLRKGVDVDNPSILFSPQGRRYASNSCRSNNSNPRSNMTWLFENVTETRTKDMCVIDFV